MSFGFILTRHVNSEKTNRYWNHCVKLLRVYYPDNQIILIDDNSNQEFVNSYHNYKNLTIIQTEYPGRGELLPYIYFLKYKWFDNAIIIHDSIFFHKRYNFEKFNYNVLPLWVFYNNDSEIDNILRIADCLNNNNIIKSQLMKWNKNTWHSCFGVMCYINYDYLNTINNKYSIINLIKIVRNRSDRCALERIFGIIFSFELTNKYSLFGNINSSHHTKINNCTYNFNDYIELFNKKKILAPVVKVWTGR
jgi:hypothetical protein